MPALAKINLVFEVTAPRADLLDDTATQVALDTLGTEYTITKLDFDDVKGYVIPGGAYQWKTTVRVVAAHT